MTLIALRIFFGGAFLFVGAEAIANARLAPLTGDLRNAGYLVLGVVLALANAAVWAPYLGEKLSEPITSLFTRDSSVPDRDRWQTLLYRLQDRGYRRWTVLLALLEGLRHPERPAAFLVGLRNARPGTWSQSFFAHRVFAFDNAQHCLEAFQVLRKYGIDPRPPRNPEVNHVLLACERQAKPDPERLPLGPAAPAIPLKRDRRIQLPTAHDGDTPSNPPRPGPGAFSG